MTPDQGTDKMDTPHLHKIKPFFKQKIRIGRTKTDVIPKESIY